MNISMKSILTLSAIICLGVGSVMAEEAPAAAPQTAASPVNAAVDGNFDTRINTWVEGVIIKLDVVGSTITIAGRNMPHATAHASMLNEIATATAGLAGDAKAAKEAEIRLSWKDKLAKADAEERPKDIEISCKVPAVGELAVVTESDLPNLDFLHHEKGMASVAPSSAAPTDSAPVPAARNDQEKAGTDAPAKSTDEKQTAALGAFGKLTIGEPVYVGYASGVVTNEAHSVIKRKTLQPTEAGK